MYCNMFVQCSSHIDMWLINGALPRLFSAHTSTIAQVIFRNYPYMASHMSFRHSFQRMKQEKVSKLYVGFLGTPPLFFSQSILSHNHNSVVEYNNILSQFSYDVTFHQMRLRIHSSNSSCPSIDNTYFLHSWCCVVPRTNNALFQE